MVVPSGMKPIAFIHRMMVSNAQIAFTINIGKSCTPCYLQINCVALVKRIGTDLITNE